MAYRQDQIEAEQLRVSGIFRLRAGAETLGGSRTIVDGEGPILAMDAGGSSRNVTLPTRAATNDGVLLLLNNISTAGENLTVKNASATTLLTLPSQGVALIFATVADETPGTREWRAVPIGGEDLALADDLSVTGDAAVTGTLTVTGAAALNGTSNTVGSATSHVLKLYGVTGSSQRASSNQVSSNAAVSASFGAGQLAILQEIMNTLTATGLWKGAA